jgi:hypothetical protein
MQVKFLHSCMVSRSHEVRYQQTIACRTRQQLHCYTARAQLHFDSMSNFVEVTTIVADVESLNN